MVYIWLYLFRVVLFFCTSYIYIYIYIYDIYNLHDVYNLGLGMQNGLHVSPNSALFVTSEMRKGLMGEMLQEILSTRVMVKQSMKR